MVEIMAWIQSSIQFCWIINLPKENKPFVWLLYTVCPQEANV